MEIKNTESPQESDASVPFDRVSLEIVDNTIYLSQSFYPSRFFISVSKNKSLYEHVNSYLKISFNIVMFNVGIIKY